MIQSRPVILVTGGTGALGPRVVEALCQAGYSVRVLALDPPEPNMFSSTVDFQRGDICDEEAIKAAVAGVTDIIHMAAMLHINSPSSEQCARFKLINEYGSSLIARAAVKAGVQRVVFFSTIAVYGNGEGRILNEDTSPNPHSEYAKTKLCAEQIMIESQNRFGEPLTTVLRLSAVYGSRIKGNYRLLLQSLARRRFIQIGAGKNRRTLVYDKDVANAVLAVMKNPCAAGRIYNVTNGIYSLSEIIKAICDVLGKKPPKLHLPITPLRVTLGMMDKGNKLLKLRFPNFTSMLEKYTEDLAVDGKRIQDETGFCQKYDLLSGWKETIKEMRERGEL